MFSTFPQTLRSDVDARHFGRCSGLDVGAPRGRENGLNPTVEKKCYNVSFEGKCASSLPVNAADVFCANFYVFRAIDERIQLPNGVLALVSLLSGHREDGLALTFTGQSTSLGNRVLVVLPDCGLPREFDSSCLPGAVGLPNVLR